MNYLRILALATPALLVLSAHAAQPAAARHYIGTATIAGVSIPVQLDLTTPARNGTVTGTFRNGDQRSPSSSGSLENGHLVLRFASFARKLEGTANDSEIKAVFSGARLTAPVPVELHADRDGKPATTFVAAKSSEPRGFTILGDWEVTLAAKSEKGEDAWTLRVTPYGGNGEIRAVILRIDGDTGGLYGRYDASAGEYRVSRFGDFSGTAYSLKPMPDGTLLVTNRLKPAEQWPARRPGKARAAKLAPPTLATQQTTVNNPKEPLRWAGPNLAGETISSTDPQFQGKVVLVAIGGSWCPNCHDEAPMLVELYNRYHARGLEVVGLSFEEEDQAKNPERLRAFITEYNIPYPVLLMGTTDELNTKLPQGKNLNCWPTSFFIGRDGLVKETHAGFSGPATGKAYVDLRAETFALVEKLLNQSNVASR